MAKSSNQRYTEKAKASFKTKLSLFLFNSVTTKSTNHSIDERSFKDFEISEELVKIYTTQYWQLEANEKINGLTLDQIYKQIQSWKDQNEKGIKALEQHYIKEVFPTVFPLHEFDQLIKAKECEYCHITEDKIAELVLKGEIRKKNFRGHSMEIDRIDSNFEYSMANCVMACYWCNNAKTDEFTFEEFKQIGDSISLIWNKRLGEE